MLHARRVPTFIQLAPIDRGYGIVVLCRDRRRAAASDNLRRKRLQAVSELRIGDFAEAFAKLLRYGTKLRPLGPTSGSRRLALPEDDAVDRRIAEEAVHPIDDHRRQMLDQGRMGTVDEQCQDPASLLPRWELY